METITAVNRRGLLKGSAGVAASTGLGGVFSAIAARQAAAATVNSRGEQVAFAASPYGPVAPVNDLATGLPLLQLPQGFSYRSFGWTGDIMADGQPTPAWHDGMAVVTTGRGRNAADVLIRNHELRSNGAKYFVKNADGSNNVAASYDPGPGAVGGCSALRVRNGRLLDDRIVIAETDVNCAGGETYWGSWLTCEETVSGPDVGSVGFTKTHGWVFEVSSDPSVTRADPIFDMGRFVHEAVSVDPRNGDVYLTEDNRNVSPFYRYIPNNKARRYGALGEGGTLWAAKVVGIDKANLMALNGPRATHVERVGQSFDIEWVRIPNPSLMPQRYTENETGNPAPIVPSSTNLTAPNVAGPFAEARDRGAFRMSRGEGIWYSRREDAFYYADTNFGYEVLAPGSTAIPRAGRGGGALWRYKPNRRNPERGVLTLVFAGIPRSTGNAIDNVTVSPRGGVMAFEDGAAVVDEFGPGNRILGFLANGDGYIFAKNNMNVTAEQLAAAGKVVPPGDYRGQEFAGGCFNMLGNTLYVNTQTPGVTYAISGPFAHGNL